MAPKTMTKTPKIAPMERLMTTRILLAPPKRGFALSADDTPGRSPSVMFA